MFTVENFRRTLSGLGLAETCDEFQALSDAHSEEGRAYHNAQHISMSLSHLNAHRELAERPFEIEMAIWFHDAVYDTRASDNEEQSAAWAERFLVAQEADSEVVKRIEAMILATKLHGAATDDEKLLIDIDLAILGSEAETFEEYDQAIRFEYSWVPEEQYRAGRASVLRSFLEREVIYQTNEFRGLYEGLARENLGRKIGELQR